MNRVFGFLAAWAILSTTVWISAQTTTSSPTPTTTTTNKPASPAKPNPTSAKPPTTSAKPSAATPATSAGPTAGQVVKPAAMSQPVQPAVQPRQPVQPAQPAGAPSAPAPTAPLPASNVAAPANSYANSASGVSRAPVTGLGVGSFVWPGGWTLTAYGCYHIDTRLFCDFDTTNPSNQQVNTAIWSGYGGVNVVTDGGKITPRHNAFFVGTDGSQFQTAYISQQPVRFIIEYDDVDTRSNAVSLVLTSNRIQSVPITPIDPSQPTGTIPARSAPAAQSGTAAVANGTSGNTLDKAQQSVDKSKKKLSDILNSVTK